jgi:hypothetical protein
MEYDYSWYSVPKLYNIENDLFTVITTDWEKNDLIDKLLKKKMSNQEKRHIKLLTVGLNTEEATQFFKNQLTYCRFLTKFYAKHIIDLEDERRMLDKKESIENFIESENSLIAIENIKLRMANILDYITKVVDIIMYNKLMSEEDLFQLFNINQQMYKNISDFDRSFKYKKFIDKIYLYNLECHPARKHFAEMIKASYIWDDTLGSPIYNLQFVYNTLKNHTASFFDSYYDLAILLFQE